MRREILTHRQPCIFCFLFYHLSSVSNHSRKNFEQPWIESCECFVSHSLLKEWCERQATCQQSIGSITHVKSNCEFSQSCTVIAFPMAENCCKNLQFIQ